MMQALACSPTLASLATRQQAVRRSSSVLAKPALSARRGLVAARGLGGKNQPKITREGEPDEYWTSKGEREGKSPFQDPLALIGIGAILGPFVLLLIFAALGIVDLTPRT